MSTPPGQPTPTPPPGQPGAPDPGTGGQGGQGSGQGGGGEALFTQDQLNRHATAEKAQGKRAGRTELLTELGGVTVEQLREALEAKRAADQAAMTEAQRAEAARVEAAAAATRREGDLARERHALRVERQLLRAGVSPEAPEGQRSPLDRALQMVTADVAADADDAAVATAVTNLRAELPQLFTAPAGPAGGGGSDPGRPGAGAPQQRPYGGNTGGSGGAGGGQGAPAGGGGGRTWGAAGRSEAARRRPPARENR